MIRNETEYQEASARLAEERSRHVIRGRVAVVYRLWNARRAFRLCLASCWMSGQYGSNQASKSCCATWG